MNTGKDLGGGASAPSVPREGTGLIPPEHAASPWGVRVRDEARVSKMKFPTMTFSCHEISYNFECSLFS